MRTSTSVNGSTARLIPEVRELAAAVLLFAGLLAFIGSCGNEDLVFPGMIVSTPTTQFTVTPTPVDTVTPTSAI